MMELTKERVEELLRKIDRYEEKKEN